MNPWWLFGLGLLVIALAVAVPRWRLWRAVNRPFPPEWVAMLESNIEIYPKLPMPLRLQLRKLILRFLHQKHFSGAGGLEITDEIRVTIAAEACMLVLNRGSDVYPALRWIIVYPTGFVVDRAHGAGEGVVEKGAKALLGESWQVGKVILAWDAVLGGARDFDDGRNVVLHEFAHQLDSETGSADGAPLLANASSYRSWASVLSEEFMTLRKDSLRGRKSLLDHYGATNPAEFFAVATEAFFERPAPMAKHHEELFRLLEAYYRVDPRDWHREQ